MEPLSTTENVAGLWRPLTEPEQVVTDNLIKVASALIRGKLKTIDTLVSTGQVDQTVVDYVVMEMIKSAVELPNRPVDAKSIGTTIGPYSETITFSAASRLDFTDDLKALIIPPSETVSVLGSIRLGAALAPGGYYGG